MVRLVDQAITGAINAADVMRDNEVVNSIRSSLTVTVFTIFTVASWRFAKKGWVQLRNGQGCVEKVNGLAKITGGIAGMGFSGLVASTSIILSVLTKTYLSQEFTWRTIEQNCAPTYWESEVMNRSSFPTVVTRPCQNIEDCFFNSL